LEPSESKTSPALEKAAYSGLSGRAGFTAIEFFESRRKKDWFRFDALISLGVNGFV
jgi:hypothetical protein